ncbi:MAG: response regulator transcription factor [Alphaproteobacteria bacterium]|nr:response regulator transcription factor [Alphaproteobacteria bacterium]
MHVLVIDDNSIWQIGIETALTCLEPGVQVARATSLEQAIQHVAHRPDVGLIIANIAITGVERHGGLRTLRAQCPATPIHATAPCGMRHEALAALDAGAAGFIPKSIAVDEFCRAVRHVLDGDVYVPRKLLDPPATAAAIQGSAPPIMPSNVLARLTPRQSEVLGQLGLGKSNTEIATALGLSEKTVRVHITAILQRLGVTNRTRAALIASGHATDRSLAA